MWFPGRLSSGSLPGPWNVLLPCLTAPPSPAGFGDHLQIKILWSDFGVNSKEALGKNDAVGSHRD